MKIDWEKERDILENLINLSLSYEEIGRKYGVSGNSVKKAAIRMGIKLNRRRNINPSEHFNKGKKSKSHFCLFCGEEIVDNKHTKGKFCSIKCQQKYQRDKFISDWKAGLKDGLVGEYSLSKHIRNYLLEKSGYKCEKCGWGEVNEYTGNIPLEVHHIDGDYRNNQESNLQVLCPNCHSLTETYKSHNKNGRFGRKKYTGLKILASL